MKNYFKLYVYNRKKIRYLFKVNTVKFNFIIKIRNKNKKDYIFIKSLSLQIFLNK